MLSSQWRPRIKPEHGLHRTPAGQVRVGGVVHGIAAEVDDPSGAVWTTLNAADGSRTVAEIVRHVLHVHPGEDADAVAAAVAQFADAGYLDNAAAPLPQQLSARERERYDRSHRLHRWIDLNRRDDPWEPQVRLKAARVTVLGLGGTGGTAAMALTASGVGYVHCVDRDVVELSNLNRQVQFDEDDIGRPKAEATAARLRRLNRAVTVTADKATISGPDDLNALIGDCDVFVLCADQPGEIRAWANTVCLRASRPWVDAGYHGPVTRASAYVPGQGACYECCWLHEHEQHLAVAPQRTYSVRRGSAKAVSAVSAGLSGYLAAHLAIALITGIPPVAPGQPVGFNLAVPASDTLPEIGRHPQCPACAPAS